MLFTFIYQVAVLNVQTGKVESPSNPFAAVVLPPNTLISDQLKSYQKLNLKAVKVGHELFDKPIN